MWTGRMMRTVGALIAIAAWCAMLAGCGGRANRQLSFSASGNQKRRRNVSEMRSHENARTVV